LDSAGSEQGPMGGICEHSNELSGSLRGAGFLDHLYSFLWRSYKTELGRRRNQFYKYVMLCYVFTEETSQSHIKLFTFRL